MAVGTTNFPTSLDDAVSLVEVKNNASTTLTSGVNSSVLSIPIADPSEFPESGYATLTDSLTAPTKTEIFIYTSKSGSNLVVPSGGRGVQGTTANSFSSGHFVEQRPTAGHHEALRGAIIAIETKLGSGSAIDAAKIADGTVSNAEFQYLNGVTSAIQTQLDGKAATSHNHAASEITSGQLALARGGTGADLSATGAGYLKQASTGANVTVGAIAAGDLPTGIDAAKIGAGAVSNTEFGYLDGVSSAIQTQLDSKAASTHSHAASDITSGTLAIARGGTATGTAPTSGQLLIGNASGGYTVATLTAGSNVTITNGNGAITIASSGGASGYATVQEEGTGLTQRATINFVGSGITAADNAGQSRTDVTLSAQLNSLADLASNGIVARTASNTITARTLTGTSNRITITNGDGVSGNPTFDIGSDVVTLTGSQTLTSKTLTAPTINGGTHTALTSLGVRSTGTGAFDLTIANSENLTAGRTLTVTVNDAARTLSLAGNLTTAAAFTTSGANSLTLTTTGATNVTLPTTGTLSTIAGTETLTNKTLTSPTIAKLANLTTNGFVKTSGGDGTLSVDTATYLTGNQTITLSGDVSGSGATGITATIGSNAVTDAKFRQSAGLSVVGRSANTTGNVADITGTDGQVLRVSGTSLGFGTIATAGIGDSQVTNAKLANSAITIAGTSTSLGGSITQDTITGLSSTGLIKRTGSNTLAIATAGTDYASAGAITGSGLTMATARLLGRSTASTGAVEEITVGTGLSLSGGSLTATQDNISVNGSAVTDADFTSTPAAPAGGINTTWQTSGSGPASVSGYLDYGSVTSAFLRKPYIYSEFVENFTNSDLVGSAISSGTNNVAAATSTFDANHPGVVLLRSSTNANSGYRYYGVGANGMRIGGGERFDIVFRTPADLSTITYRFGLHDTGSSNDASDGCYFELSGSGAVVGKTASNSTRTTSSTIATLSTDTWYHGVIQINSGATSVSFTLYSEAGSSLGTQSITTNIPTAQNRETLLGIIATSSGTTAIDLLYLDFASLQWTKALARGQ